MVLFWPSTSPVKLDISKVTFSRRESTFARSNTRGCERRCRRTEKKDCCKKVNWFYRVGRPRRRQITSVEYIEGTATSPNERKILWRQLSLSFFLVGWSQVWSSGPTINLLHLRLKVCGPKSRNSLVRNQTLIEISILTTVNSVNKICARSLSLKSPPVPPTWSCV